MAKTAAKSKKESAGKADKPKPATSAGPAYWLFKTELWSSRVVSMN